MKQFLLEIWANAQRDGRPSECRWRPVFNAANYSRGSDDRPGCLNEQQHRLTWVDEDDMFSTAHLVVVTGQLADTPSRGLPTSGLDDSRTRQLADATGDFACLVFVLLAASARPRVVQSATCPVRELAIRELAYPRVVQLPLSLGGHTTDA